MSDTLEDIQFKKLHPFAQNRIEPPDRLKSQIAVRPVEDAAEFTLQSLEALLVFLQYVGLLSVRFDLFPVPFLELSPPQGGPFDPTFPPPPADLSVNIFRP